MKKLYLCIFITVFFTGVLHAEDTPYMKLIDSHKGIDKMIVCLPMIQKTADNYKKAIQISIKEDSIDVQDYLNKKDNPPDKFKSFHGLMKGYHEAVLVRMVGEWWIAVRIPKEDEAKKKYQKNHIINKAINLSHDIPYTEHLPYISKCMDGFNQLAKKNDLIKKYIEILNKKVEEEIYGSVVKTQIVEDKEEQPKYFVCENKNKDPFYIKFHITDKKWFDWDKLKWVTGTVRRNDKVYEGAIPTLEAHENRERFSNIIFNKKMFPIFSSEKYYVFYEEKNDSFFWGGSYEPYAINIIIDRFSLNILKVKNKKIINLGAIYNYSDSIIESMFEESKGYYSRNEEVTFKNGRTVTLRRTLTNYKCSETDIKQKI